MDELKEQIDATLKNLSAGEIQREDRVFLNHVLEEFGHLVDMQEFGGNTEELAWNRIGSTRELVEDGLSWEA